MKATAFMIALSIVLMSTVASAEVPGLMNYQGTMTDGDGVALDTTVAMTFSIYTDSVGGSVEWTETQPAVVVSSGLFNVLLGSVNAISDDVFSDPVRWLGIQVGADPELIPRQRITSVGYAFRAAEADTAQYARNALGGSDGDWTISGNDIYSAVSGDVGIGTSSPASKLDVSGEINVSSVYKIGGNQVLSTTGTQNTFLGFGAGANNTSSYGTFLGYNTGYSNQGQHNTFVGRYAGYANTTGQRNTFVASNAGRETTSGSYNVFVGYEVGRKCSTGVNNVFLGYRAGYYESGSNKLYIANSLTTSPLVYGEFDNDILAIDGKVGIGTTSPDEVLHLYGPSPSGVGDGHLKIEGSETSGNANTGGGILFSGHSGAAPLDWGYLRVLKEVAGPGYPDSYMSFATRSVATGIAERMRITSEGKVGIGTTSPSEKLEVNGNAHVQGNLTWQAKTGYVALSAAAFRPTAETQAYLNPGWWVGTTSILGFSASVQLPHGASVEKLTYHYSDSSSTHNGSLSLYRNPMNGSVSDQMASVATSGSGGDGSAFSTSIDYATVDNSQYSYYLFMVGIDPNRKIKCYGVVIEYTFTEPY